MNNLYININDINNYLNNIKVFKAEATYKFYKIKLLKFYNYFNDNNLKLEQENINNFILELKKTNKNNTINKYIIIIKKFLEYINIKNIKLYSLRKDSKRFNNLNEKELKTLNNYIKLLELKHKLIILLFLETGIRIRELLYIKIENINIKECFIHLIITKNKKDRYVFFTKNTSKLLKEFIKNKNIKEFLFNTSYGAIYRIFKNIKDNTNIKSISPHILRHTFATYLLNNNINLFTLKNLLGHENLTTTQIYLHNNKQFDYKEYKKATQKLK